MALFSAGTSPGKIIQSKYFVFLGLLLSVPNRQ